jgi:CHASE2 domain-containing sensor protein
VTTTTAPRTRSDRGLRLAYGANLVGAGVPGAVLLAVPQTGTELLFGVPADPFVATVLGSVWLAVGATSVLGLRDPRRYAGLLVLQVVYKTLWIVAGAARLLATGTAPPATVPFAAFFAVIVVAWVLALRSAREPSRG